VVALESLLQIVVNKESDAQHLFVFDLTNQTEELWLHLCERIKQVRQSLVVLLAWRNRVDDFVG
jgi:hypothetical protein